MEYWLPEHSLNCDVVCDDSHAWCIVEVQPNMWMDVECVSSPPRIASTVRHYDVRYANIWEAMKNAPGEFDWFDRIGNGAVIGWKNNTLDTDTKR